MRALRKKACIFLWKLLGVCFDCIYTGTFHTDTDISGGGGDIRERELMPWMPDEDESEGGLSYLLCVPACILVLPGFI